VRRRARPWRGELPLSRSPLWTRGGAGSSRRSPAHCGVRTWGSAPWPGHRRPVSGHRHPRRGHRRPRRGHRRPRRGHHARDAVTEALIPGSTVDASPV